VVVCLDFVIVGETFEEEGCDDTEALKTRRMK
jgi:hypothetical protein